MRILLVEDDPEQLEPLYTALSDVGHIVDAVENGETAFAIWMILPAEVLTELLISQNYPKGWLAGIGVTSGDQLFDPRVNATAAYTLYQRAGGWGPWS